MVNPATSMNIDLPPDERDSGPEHGSGDPVREAGAEEDPPQNVGKSHPACPSAVDTVMDNPSDEKGLKTKGQKALSPKELRETATVESEFLRPQVREKVKVKFELDEASAQEPKKKCRYNKHPETSAKTKELQHTLQESRGSGSLKEVFGKLGDQLKNVFHTAPVQSSSQSMEVPVQVSLILTEETEGVYGTPEFLDNMHRKLRQSNLESSSVKGEVKTHRGATEGDPKVDGKQLTDTVKDIRHFSDTGNEISETPRREIGVLPAQRETRFPTTNHIVPLAISVLTKCEKLTNICKKNRNLSKTENKMPETLYLQNVVFSAETETTFEATQDRLNVNGTDKIPIPKRLLSSAVGLLTKCEKLIKMCREITDIFPDRLPIRIMTSNNHHLHPRTFLMLAEISFLIIKLLSQLISALISLIYIIIHSAYMDIVPENIIPSLDTLMLALPHLEIKYKILCIDYILQLKKSTPEEIDEALQNYQTERRQPDTSEQTGVSGEKGETSSQVLETLCGQDEACSLAPLEVPRCSLSLLEKDSVKIRLTIVGIKLTLIGQKILELTVQKHPSK